MSVAEDGYHVFTVNVSAENIHGLFCRLAAEVNEPGFLVLETSVQRDIEQELRGKGTDLFQRDVHILGDLKWPDAKSIVDCYAELLTHDGILNFGFVSHAGRDEVFVGPYKIFTIYADEPSRYETALDEMGFTKVEHLKTVWDNFTQDSPGQRRPLTDTDPTVSVMLEQLKQKGLSFVERRED